MRGKIEGVTKWALFNSLATGVAVTAQTTAGAFTFRAAMIEREDGSGKSWNVRTVEGETIYLRTAD